jgi:hypothetical protein
MGFLQRASAGNLDSGTPTIKRFTLGAVCVLATGLLSAAAFAAPKIGDPPEAMNMKLVGFNDLQGRSAYQPTIHHQGNRWIAYIGHHGGTDEVGKPINPITGQAEFNGTSIIDVTDPAHPVYLHHLPGRRAHTKPAAGR